MMSRPHPARCAGATTSSGVAGSCGCRDRQSGSLQLDRGRRAPCRHVTRIMQSAATDRARQRGSTRRKAGAPGLVGHVCVTLACHNNPDAAANGRGTAASTATLATGEAGARRTRAALDRGPAGRLGAAADRPVRARRLPEPLRRRARAAVKRVERNVRILHEQAMKVFETQELMIDQLNDRLRGFRLERFCRAGRSAQAARPPAGAAAAGRDDLRDRCGRAPARELAQLPGRSRDRRVRPATISRP